MERPTPLEVHPATEPATVGSLERTISPTLAEIGLRLARNWWIGPRRRPSRPHRHR